MNTEDLFNYKLENVLTDYFLRNGAFKWVGTPWTTCNKPCGTGQQNRTVICAPLNSPVIADKTDDSYCDWEPKIAETQYCNMFHCELQCRQDVGRRPCALYQADERRNAPVPDIRRLTCEFYGCCFVPNPGSEPDSSLREAECYAQPHLNYQEWIPLPYGECTRSCVHKDDNTKPIQSRRNLCAWTNGSVANPLDCPSEIPDTVQTCNSEATCVSCFTSGCHPRRCEKEYNQGDSWNFSPICKCLNGYSGNNCAEKPSCSGWEAGNWGFCQSNREQTREVAVSKFYFPDT